jgi:hypothetical protein
MAQRTDSYLTTEANIIQNETATGANTALRVGTMLNDVIDSKINNDRVSDSTALGNSATLVPSQNAVKTYVDTVLVGYLNDRGNYDPTITSGYPTTGGSGSGGIIEQGDLFFISADGSIISGDAVPITTPVFTGYTVRALVSTPGQLYANWAISNVGIGYIPENSANKSTDNTLGGLFPSGVLFSTQKAVKEYVDNEIATAVPYTAENVANKIQDLTINPTSSVEYPSSAAVTNFVAAQTLEDVVSAGSNATTSFGCLNPTNANVSATTPDGSTASITASQGVGGSVVISNNIGGTSEVKASNLTTYRVHQLPDTNGTIALVNPSAFTGTRVINAETYTWQNGILISIT